MITSKVPASAVVTWTSDNEEIAAIGDNGYARGISAGSTTIRASITVNGITYTDTCAVTVYA